MLRSTTLVGASVALVTALSGCSLLMGKASDAPPPQTVEKERPAVVTEVLKDVEPLTKVDGVPTSKQFFDQMEQAGYKPEDLEATIDASPLGHDVPSKMFGVKVKEGCVIGEIRQGKVSGSLYPPSDSTSACLLGHVDRPEGVKAPTGEKRQDGDADNGVGFLPGDDLHERKDGQPDSSGGGASSGGGSSDGGSSGGSSSDSGSSSGGGGSGASNSISGG